jgi:hypothetical protein
MDTAYHETIQKLRSSTRRSFRDPPVSAACEEEVGTGAKAPDESLSQCGTVPRLQHGIRSCPPPHLPLPEGVWNKECVLRQLVCATASSVQHAWRLYPYVRGAVHTYMCGSGYGVA